VKKHCSAKSAVLRNCELLVYPGLSMG